MRLITFALVALWVPIASAYPGDYVVPAGGTFSVSTDFDVNSYDIVEADDIYGKYYDTNTLVDEMQLHGANAYPRATGSNRDGGSVELVPGLGSHTITVDDYTQCGLADVALVLDGVLVDTLVEGTDWTAATSNADTCSSLLTAVEAVSGISASSVCDGAVLYVYFDATIYSASISNASGGGCVTMYNGSSGTLYMRGATSITGTLAVSQSATAPVYKSASADPADNVAGVAIGNAESYCFESSPASTDVCLTADSSELVTLSGSSGLKAPLFKSSASDPADNAAGIALGSGELYCAELSGGGTDGCFSFTAAGYYQYQNIEGILIVDADEYAIGSSIDATLGYQTAGTPDTAVFGVSSDSSALVISEQSDIATNWNTCGGVACTNPTFIVQSADANDPNKRIFFYHDQNYAVIDSQLGQIHTPDGINVAATGSTAASSGRINLANADSQCWEASPAGTDACVSVNSSEGVDFTGISSVNLADNIELWFGSSNDAGCGYQTAPGPDTLVCYTSSDSNAWLLAEKADAGTDWRTCDGSACVDPTFVVQSADANDPNKRIMIYHDQTDSYIRSGKGEVRAQSLTGFSASDDDKGAKTTLTAPGTEVTCDGGGSATLTASNVIPEFAFLIGVTTRVVSALSGSTGYTVGDGSDSNLYGTSSAVTLGSTTANPSASWGNPVTAEGSVVLTFSGGNCTAGTIRVVPHYFMAYPSTSN